MSATDLGPILKAAYPQVVATLTRVFGDMDRAMDATQDALVKALQRWQVDGVPQNPVAWLITVARNGAVDQLRREQRQISLDSNVVALPSWPATSETDDADDVALSAVPDDLLRLMFACCHPQLPPSTQIVLILKVVLGFSTQDIARGLLSSRASIEKKITRARQRLRDSDAVYELPTAAELPERLDAVLRAIYLLFNEGYSRLTDANLGRSNLIEESIRLARMVSRLFRHDPQPRALLALLLLTAARIPARQNSAAAYVPLTEQDRTLWDKAMIREGIALIDALCVARHPPSAYQIQAAIAAIHNAATDTQQTDWEQIVGLYESLKHYDASPVIQINQAVALCFAGQVEAALARLGPMADGFSEYQPYHAALAYVAAQAGRVELAKPAYRRAIELAPSAAERRYLQGQLDALD